MAVDKKYYLLKDGTAYFSDFLLISAFRLYE